MKNGFSFALLLILKIIIFFIDSTQQKTILIVIVYDGFQNNYLDRGLTPTLNNFKHNGVSSAYMRTVYPALMKPSLHTISSGWGVRTHFQYTRTFTQDDDKYRPYKQSTPLDKKYIWELNDANKGKSYCLCWPPEIKHAEGKKCEDEGVARGSTLKARADKMIELLNKTVEADIPNLIMLYVHKLDKITHFFGPLSRNSSLFIRRLDLLTKYIFNKLMEIDMYHKANIFILSDHGVRTVMDDGKKYEIEKDDRTLGAEPKKSTVTFTSVDDDVNGYYMVGNAQLKDQIKDFVIDVEDFTKLGKLKNKFTVVRTPNGINSTNSIIEFAACPGYVLSLAKWKADKFTEKFGDLLNPVDGKVPRGVHGYLRQNDAMFMAKGPNLARFKVVDPFNMEDLFCAFAKLLHIQGDFERDGNFSRIRTIFVQSKPINWAEILVTIVGLAVIICVVFYLLIQYLVATSSLR